MTHLLMSSKNIARQEVCLDKYSQQLDENYMKLALIEAEKAVALGEVPVGAIIVTNEQVIASGYNRRETDKDPLAHAELIAINNACKYLDAWRLSGCTLYVTLEPCPMCAGAIIQSRLDRVVFATTDPKAGCVGSLMNLLQDQRFNHQAIITNGILAEQSKQLLQDFFRKLRTKKQQLID